MKLIKHLAQTCHCSSTGAALGGHAWVIFEHNIAVIIEVKKRQRREYIRDAAWSWNFWVAADGVNDALDGSVICWIQLLFTNMIHVRNNMSHAHRNSISTSVRKKNNMFQETMA